MMGWAEAIPLVATIFGALVSGMLGLAIAKLTGIERHLEQLNGKVFAHLTQPDIHTAGFSRIDEQIKNLLRTVTVAHERIDRVKSESA